MAEKINSIPSDMLDWLQEKITWKNVKKYLLQTKRYML